MEGSSKWVKWYRILAIIGFAALVILSLVTGWKAARYTYDYGYHVGHHMSVFLEYAGIGCAIAVVELIVSMMLCEFLDNVRLIAHKLSNWDYSKATREFIEELAHNPKAGNLIANKSEPEQNINKEKPVEEGTERNTTSQNKTHAPVLPTPTRQNSDKVVCPLCKTVQRSHRRICMNCGVPFITEE